MEAPQPGTGYSAGFFQDYWQRVCLTMIDKNIVIAVSYETKWSAYNVLLDLLVVLVTQVRPRKNDCPCVVEKSSYALRVAAAFSPSIAH